MSSRWKIAPKLIADSGKNLLESVRSTSTRRSSDGGTNAGIKNRDINERKITNRFFCNIMIAALHLKEVIRLEDLLQYWCQELQVQFVDRIVVHTVQNFCVIALLVDSA